MNSGQTMIHIVTKRDLGRRARDPKRFSYACGAYWEGVYVSTYSLETWKVRLEKGSNTPCPLCALQVLTSPNWFAQTVEESTELARKHGNLFTLTMRRL